jgi:hypothetical protein
VPVPPLDIPEPEPDPVQPASTATNAMIVMRLPIQIPVDGVLYLFRGKIAMASLQKRHLRRSRNAQAGGRAYY